MKQEGEIQSRAYNQLEAFEAASLFAKTEGIIPAPEPSHAIKGAIDEALKCKETGEAKTLLFVLTGHGFFDMAAYGEYFAGNLQPCEYPTEKVAESMEKLQKLYPWLNDVRKKYINGGQ